MWYNNRLIQILIVAIIVIGICMFAKLNLSGSVGSNGIHADIGTGK